MSHVVVYSSVDGQRVHHQVEGLDEAVRHVEHLRNAGQGTDARIFRMIEVPIEVKTYYRVEVAAMADGMAAPGLAAPVAPVAATAQPAKVSSAGPAPAPAAAAAGPAAVPAAPAGAAPVKGEPAPAGSGGRFGLFGKS